LKPSTIKKFGDNGLQSGLQEMVKERKMRENFHTCF